MIRYTKRMVFGIGVDIVDIRRIERIISCYGAKFVDRVFTDSEKVYCYANKNYSRYFAKRFAAKEAFLKALGCGIADGIRWVDIEVSNDTKGKPSINTSGITDNLLKNASSNGKALLSLSDEFPYAVAYVIIV